MAMMVARTVCWIVLESLLPCGPDRWPVPPAATVGELIVESVLVCDRRR
jgi:hypothetical protein